MSRESYSIPNEEDFRLSHQPPNPGDYYRQKVEAILRGEPVWMVRNTDPLNDGVVFEYFRDNRRIGFIDEEAVGECLIYILDEDSEAPTLYDTITRGLLDAVGVVEAQD